MAAFKLYPPEFNIELAAFTQDPYPALAQMRAESPICFVPQLNAVLLTRRDDIFVCEKNVDVFSSDQPGGLMTVLMGQNMMRKDGPAHLTERRAAQLAVSPKTVKDIWRHHFKKHTNELLDNLAQRKSIDIVTDFAMPVSGHALRHITGLINMTPDEMDSVSQGMIDGIANYSGDKAVEKKCHQSTAFIDSCIDSMLSELNDTPNASLLSVLTAANQPMESVRANIKLAISGGQNEPRDAIAGLVWALLTNPEQLQSIVNSKVNWRQAFEEYVRWISPIGMSPRRIAQRHTYNNIEFKPESRAFLMFASGNRDESIFERPEEFDVTRNNAKSISFGAGPHFCAGAAASRCLIADVALPMLFERFPKMALNGDVEFTGWAFRGPISVPVQLHG